MGLGLQGGLQPQLVFTGGHEQDEVVRPGPQQVLVQLTGLGVPALGKGQPGFQQPSAGVLGGHLAQAGPLRAGGGDLAVGQQLCHQGGAGVGLLRPGLDRSGEGGDGIVMPPGQVQQQIALDRPGLVVERFVGQQAVQQLQGGIAVAVGHGQADLHQSGRRRPGCCGHRPPGRSAGQGQVALQQPGMAYRGLQPRHGLGVVQRGAAEPAGHFPAFAVQDQGFGQRGQGGGLGKVEVDCLLQLGNGGDGIAIGQQLAAQHEVGLARARIGPDQLGEFNLGGLTALVGQRVLGAGDCSGFVLATAGQGQHQGRHHCQGQREPRHGGLVQGDILSAWRLGRAGSCRRPRYFIAGALAARPGF